MECEFICNCGYKMLYNDKINNMKKYKITITDKKTDVILETEEFHSLLAKNKLTDNYKLKYRFHPNVVKIEIERLINIGGKQIDLEDMIADCGG